MKKTFIAQGDNMQGVIQAETIHNLEQHFYKTDCDGRFVAKSNDTVLDTQTGLMWAAKDNGENIECKDAKKYCASYRKGGYSDWRLPTIEELEGLYDRQNTGYDISEHGTSGKMFLTNLIDLTGWWVWSSDTKKIDSFSFPLCFNFHLGMKDSGPPTIVPSGRVLPVRGGECRFITKSNGTVLDSQTGLIWAARDNGENINWMNAKKYCEDYRGGGYSDWRLPTIKELEGLYDESKGYYPMDDDTNYIVCLTELIKVTDYSVWTSDIKKDSSRAASFIFTSGRRFWASPDFGIVHRALPVRGGN